ncbi:MAG: hypothetical protein ASARMPRED_004611 [Alectoria sarmentosa]|nr:MAG: hypothetical protein ASARMPRED_004611 [Alectoria sarmentosa]
MAPPVNSEFHSPIAFWRQILTVFRSRRYPSTCRLYQQEDTTIEDIEDLLRGVGSAGGELNVATETDAGNRISANSTDQGVTADRGSLIPLEKRREGEQDKTKGGGNDLHFRRHDNSIEVEGTGHVSLAPNAVVQPEMRPLPLLFPAFGAANAQHGEEKHSVEVGDRAGDRRAAGLDEGGEIDTVRKKVCRKDDLLVIEDDNQGPIERDNSQSQFRTATIEEQEWETDKGFEYKACWKSTWLPKCELGNAQRLRPARTEKAG